jgi:hypothetical protein
MNTDELRLKIRAQVRSAVSRQATAAGQPTSGNPAASHKALVVPLRLGNAQDTSALTQLFMRLAGSNCPGIARQCCTCQKLKRHGRDHHH